MQAATYKKIQHLLEHHLNQFMDASNALAADEAVSATLISKAIAASPILRQFQQLNSVEDQIVRNTADLVSTLRSENSHLLPTILRQLSSKVPTTKFLKLFPSVSRSTLQRARFKPARSLSAHRLRSVRRGAAIAQERVRRFWFEHCSPATPGTHRSSRIHNGYATLRYIQRDTLHELYKIYVKECDETAVKPMSLWFFRAHRYVSLTCIEI